MKKILPFILASTMLLQSVVLAVEEREESVGNEELLAMTSKVLSATVEMDVESDLVIGTFVGEDGTSFDLYFESNGGEFSELGESRVSVEESGDFSGIPEPEREGYAFEGWYTEVVGGVRGYDSGEVASESTLYALWSNESDFEFSNGTITKYVGNGGDVVIPSTIGGVAVTEIGKEAFLEIETITSLVIGDSVTSIATSAFKRNIAMTSLTVGSGMEDIGGYAFYGCSSLTTVNLAEGLDELGDYSFAYCTDLVDVVLPKTLREIKANAFYGCLGLESATVPSSVETMGLRVFCYKTVSSAADSTSLALPKLTVYVETDSVALAYCEDGSWNGTTLNYEIVDLGEARYTVTFDGNGGEVSTESAKASYTGKLSSLPVPTLSGYTFTGWFTSKTGSTEVTTSTVFEKDTTVYAQWAEDVSTTYKVTFDANGGEVDIVSATTDGNGLLFAVPVPTRDGYVFEGWFTTTTGTTEVTEEYVFTRDRTIYAQWTSEDSETYTVTFDANGGEVSTETKTTNSSGKVTSLPEPTLTGYLFDGWFTSKTGSTEVTTSTVFEKDTTVYAQWTAGYTVEFDANGGSVDTESEVTDEDGFLSDLPVPTRSGYTFAGWFTTKTGSTEVTEEYEFTKNRTIYAQWTADVGVFTVKFDANGGNSGTVYMKMDSDGMIDEFPTPTHDSLTFDGWYLTKNSGNTVVTEKTVFTERTFLYARWVEGDDLATYRVFTYATNEKGTNYGGSIKVSESSPVSGETVTVTVTPSNYKYTLDSFAVKTTAGVSVTTKNNGDGTYSYTQPAKDVEITAVFAFQSGRN